MTYVYRIVFAFIFLFSGSVHLFAQVRVIPVDPAETDAAIPAIHGPHLAVYDPQVRSRHELILMIPGTGGSAAGFHEIDSIFATMGYHVISLDYKNTVITVVCAHSKDSTCYDRFRKEIVTGTPVSAKVEVDSTNSILRRFRSVLSYLAKNDPEGGWNDFIKHGQPRWSRIITAGHSQGAGHAAYLGKMFRVNRVLMFSGPQDYLDDLHCPAGWQAEKGATPPGRYFAFLHLKDPFNVKHQIANCDLLLQSARPDTAMVQPGVPIQGKHHILVNDIATKNPHGSTLSPRFRNVWTYMLGRK
jgi:hypothetical protein